MHFNKTLTISMCAGFLFLDQFLKWQALHSWSNDHLLNRWFGWHPFFNPGVAFGIPLPNLFIIILSAPIVGSLAWYVYHSNDIQAPDVLHHSSRIMGLGLILAGALSNLIDRIRFSHTIDYVLIFTAVINLADVLIVIGFILYFLQLTEKHKTSTTV